MALVAYDDSMSEGEDEDSSNNSSSVQITVGEITNGEDQSNEDVNLEPTHSSIGKMLSDLPKTKPSESSKIVVDDKIEDFIPKYLPSSESIKEKPKVKIMIPSLSQFKDDYYEPKSKKAKVENKGCGLLSILPPVKSSPISTKSFIPDAVKNKNKKPITKSTSTTSGLVPQNVRKRAELVKKAAIEKITKSTVVNSASDAESDDDIEVPHTFDEEMWNKICGRPKPKEQPKMIVENAKTNYYSEQMDVNIAPEPKKPYEGLDNTAFKELMGTSKRPQNIKLIDVNEDEILPEKEIWMTKALTDPDYVPKPAVEEPVDPTRRKKHHITYLAEQAKANEQELQGQWSASKFTRNQTRAKYGF